MFNQFRSQLAEAFFNSRAPKGYRATSAGIQYGGPTAGSVHAAAREAGLDLSKKKSKIVTEEMIKNADNIRKVRDKIKKNVEELITSLEKDNVPRKNE